LWALTQPRCSQMSYVERLEYFLLLSTSCHVSRVACDRLASLHPDLLTLLRTREHSEPEEIELGTAIHASFDQLEKGDVSLGRAITLLPC